METSTVYFSTKNFQKVLKNGQVYTFLCSCVGLFLQNMQVCFFKKGLE